MFKSNYCTSQMRLQINLTTAKWGDGGWKPNYFDIADTYMCQFMFKYAEKTMRELLTILKVPFACPFPAVIILFNLIFLNCLIEINGNRILQGTYSTEGFVYDGYMEKPVMYGEFRIDLNFLRNDSSFACIRAFVTTKPKKTTGFGR